MENPIFNPTPSGLKGQNRGLETAKYQVYKGFKGAAKLFLLAVGALIQQGKDVVMEMFRPGSSRR